MKSRSIPITTVAQSASQMEEEHELEQDNMLADYRDYVFYSRLVNGISRKQESTQDRTLRYQNQALLKHIVLTRYGTPPSNDEGCFSNNRSRSSQAQQYQQQQGRGFEDFGDRGTISLAELTRPRRCITDLDQDLIFDLDL
jgi:hypothetical protein